MSDPSEALPRIAAYKPSYVEPEQGRAYHWCSCGLSQNQPWCDGSHVGTGFEPVRYTTTEANQEVLFCTCKHSGTPPFCDGSHNNLREEYDEDDPRSRENAAIPTIPAQANGYAMLDGGCCVIKPDRIARQTFGNLSLARPITADNGARHQSLFTVDVTVGESPVLSFADRHCVILVTAGSGHISISGRQFAIAPEMGLYVRPGEAFAVSCAGSQTVTLFVSACPLADQPDILAAMPDNFQQVYPQRSVGIDPSLRQAMADRFFQMLVDKSVGSDLVTQFIGDIPCSKAALHRHLYEETIVILRGEGYLWTERLKTPVASGDVIFLPRKQLHSLQCTDPDGMMLAGVIYPGDNPAINY